jgi:Zn-dependent protease
MFGRGWKVATIRGIPVNVDSSWLWIAVLAVWSLWSRFQVYPGVNSNAALGFAVLGAALFFGSVFLHELAHAVAARLNGIEVHGITLVFFGGFTSARSDEKGAGPALLIAAVGPGTSLAIGLLLAAAHSMVGSTEPLSEALRSVAAINLFMAAFNVLPGLPLDGGRMLQAAVWGISKKRDLGTRVAARGGMVVGGLLLFVAIYEVSRNNLFGAVWIGMIGLFVYQGARTSEHQIGLASRLAGATVADAMDRPPPAVPAEMTLSEALDRFLRGHESEAFPVVDQGRVIGMVSFNSAREHGSRDPLLPVRSALIPLENVLTAHPDEPLDQVSARLGTGRAALVLRDGELVGAITGSGLARWASSSRTR